MNLEPEFMGNNTGTTGPAHFATLQISPEDRRYEHLTSVCCVGVVCCLAVSLLNTMNAPPPPPGLRPSPASMLPCPELILPSSAELTFVVNAVAPLSVVRMLLSPLVGVSLSGLPSAVESLETFWPALL